MKHVGFKSYPWFFDQLELGRKTFDARFADWSDPRHYELHFSSTRAAGPKQDVETITFVSTEDYSRRITFRYDRMEFVHWAPDWSFLILGERVETPSGIDWGPNGEPVQNTEIRRQRAIGRAVMSIARRVVPVMVGWLPARWQIPVKNALPCVFGKTVAQHIECLCTRCDGPYNTQTHLLSAQGVSRNGGAGTHRYQSPDSCTHQAALGQGRQL